MTICLRIPRGVCEQMRADLIRAHPFAAERVGFARAATGTVSNGTVMLVKSYWPVSDDQYVDDPFVGARINSTAIRTAMQDVLSGSHSLFHVHFHPHKGRTRLSRTDVAEIPKLVSSFRNVGPKAAHGFLILTRDHALAFALSPGATAFSPVTKITVVGYPTVILT